MAFLFAEVGEVESSEDASLEESPGVEPGLSNAVDHPMIHVLVKFAMPSLGIDILDDTSAP